MIFILATLGITAISSPKTQAHTLKQLLMRPEILNIKTNMSSLNIEYCLALGISDWSNPILFRDEKITQIYATPSRSDASVVALSFTIIDKIDVRLIEVRAAGNMMPNWVDRAKNLAQKCTEEKS